MTWEPDYKAVFRNRLKRLAAMRRDKATAAAHWQHYKHNPVDFIQDWVDTYDPRRLSMPHVPFQLFPKQADFIRWLFACFTDRADGVVPKPRDMGITYCCAALAVHLWTFWPGSKIGFGSRVVDKVDKLGDLDSIFEKIRAIIRRLPSEFKPKHFREKDDLLYLKLINRDNGSTITGEGGDNIGRGGRNSVYFLDEAAFVERPQIVDSALDDNSDCKVYVSTHNGPGTTFYRKCQSTAYRQFRFKWQDNPLKTWEWYYAEKAKRDPVNFAQEIECDPEASLENIVIPAAWVKAARELWQFIKPSGKRVAGLDIGGGSDLSVFVVRQGSKLFMPVSWSDPDVINTAANATALCAQQRAEYLQYDVFGIGGGVMAALKRLPNVNSRGINVGQPPTESVWPDNETSADKFVNLKAELWWMMRDRFLKTFEHWLWLNDQGGIMRQPDELITLPPSGQEADTLAAQLSVVRWFRTPRGKIQIETKEQLAKRGVKSPDHADAAALSFAPVAGTVRVVTVDGMY